MSGWVVRFITVRGRFFFKIENVIWKRHRRRTVPFKVEKLATVFFTLMSAWLLLNVHATKNNSLTFLSSSLFLYTWKQYICLLLCRDWNDNISSHGSPRSTPCLVRAQRPSSGARARGNTTTVQHTAAWSRAGLLIGWILSSMENIRC